MRWPCHIWLFDRKKFTSLETNLGVGAFEYVPFFFSLFLSGKSSDMTEILLTGTLRLKSIKSTKFVRSMPLRPKTAHIGGQMFYKGLYKETWIIVMSDEATRFIAWIFSMQHYLVKLY